jgi:hypothetical protein
VPAAVSDALASPLPTGGVPLTVFAAPYRGAGRTASVLVAVEMDAARFEFTPKGDRMTAQIEVVHTATDQEGRADSPLRYTAALSFKPDTYERARTGGLRVLSQVDLPPGRYQLHVAAGDAAGGSGGVVYDLDVPDFTVEGLSMSALALTSTHAADAVTVPPQRPLPIPPTATVVTARAFSPGDVIGVFGDVYDNSRRPSAHTVDIATELRSDAGTMVRRSSETRSSADLAGATGGYGFAVELPLSGLAPGLYVIHVEARASAGNRPPVSRDVQIRIR